MIILRTLKHIRQVLLLHPVIFIFMGVFVKLPFHLGVCTVVVLVLQSAGNGRVIAPLHIRHSRVNGVMGGIALGTGGHQNNGVCVQKDDMAEILEKMIAADVIVMATPVYFYTMDAQMKTLIDRCVARYTEISNKAFYFIATAADGEKRSLERTIEGFRGFLYCLEGAREKGIVYGSGAWKKGDIKESPALNEAYEMGRHA